MTKTQALMIIRNPATYSRAKVREAALFVLSLLNSKPEDIQRASSLL